MTRDNLLKLLLPGEGWVDLKAPRRRGKPPEPMVVWVDGQKCRLIELSKGCKTLIDDADMELVNTHYWSMRGAGYAGRTDYNGGNQRSTYVAWVVFGDPNVDEVDHINQVKLDNRRLNLRAATHSSNNANRVNSAPDKYSKYKGVTRYEREGRWLAEIVKDRVKTYVYRGFDEIEAAKAYDAAARKLHGEFACLNFPDDNKISAVI